MIDAILSGLVDVFIVAGIELGRAALFVTLLISVACVAVITKDWMDP